MNTESIDIITKQRLQWRRNQQKCRERKRQKIRLYQESLLQIKESILYLETYQSTLAQALSFTELSTIHSLLNTYRINLLTTYYTLFQHGVFYPSTLAAVSLCPFCQYNDTMILYSFEDIQRSMQIRMHTLITHLFDPNVSYYSKGMDAFWDQWRGYSLLFDDFHLEILKHEILYTLIKENECLIRSTFRIYLTISLRTLQYLMPSLSSDLYPSLLGKNLCLDGYTKYTFQGVKVIHVEGEKQIIPCLIKGFNGNLKDILTINQERMKENGWINENLLRKLLQSEMLV